MHIRCSMYCRYTIENKEEYIPLPESILPTRLDKVLRTILESKGISREKIKQYIQQGYVYVNGTVCTHISKKIAHSDTIDISIPEEHSLLTQEEGILDVIYEDPSFIIINKPASLVVHPCISTPHGTLLQRALFHYPELAQMSGERPAIVHRLDKDTTGLLLLARTEQARYALIQAFSERTITKHYLAFVEGLSPEHNVIEEPIGRDSTRKTRMCVSPHGKPAYTEYTRIATFPQGRLPYPVSLLHIRIATGRTHQIRVHLSHTGFPILGDTLYGAHHSFVQRPLLHACTLEFNHPITGESLHYSQMPPLDFEETYSTLSTQSIHIVLTGSAGSGKSTVLQQYIDAGIPCCSADDIIDELYSKGNSIWHYLKQSYGSRFLNTDDTVNKAKVLEAMSTSTHYKEEIERVIHSFLIEAIHLFWQEHITSPYTVLEIPLYFESALFRKNCPTDLVITVHSPQEIRKKRMREKGWSDEKIDYVIENQYSDAYKNEHADYVIENTSHHTVLQEEITNSLEYIHQYYIQRISGAKEEYIKLLTRYI